MPNLLIYTSFAKRSASYSASLFEAGKPSVMAYCPSIYVQLPHFFGLVGIEEGGLICS
ncbi:Hypothetical predicted protein [Prunus dulcis]|uniref:Uncharacterized protein n=1 Tax=Prunus dulcis TaxID=3755 RepID=A0A5E4G1G7_PRUDU|nr:Hypothetical predicted protein [Prunus dulcis]